MSEPIDENGSEQVAIFLGQLRDVACGMVARTLGVERSFESIAAMIDGANSMTDIATDRLEKMVPAANHLDCGKGCSHCCKLPLIASDPARVFYLTHYIETHASAEELAAWSAALGRGEHRPCALLDNDQCIAYAVRP